MGKGQEQCNKNNCFFSPPRNPYPPETRPRLPLVSEKTIFHFIHFSASRKSYMSYGMIMLCWHEFGLKFDFSDDIYKYSGKLSFLLDSD